MARLKPVARYPAPSYPTKEMVQLDPEILYALPKRWQANPAALAVLVLLGTGCRKPTKPISQDPAPPASVAPPVKTKNPLIKLAPLFAHGQGTAATGGLAATRIVFLPEDEALELLLEEFNRASIRLSRDSLTLAPIQTPVTSTAVSFAKRADPGLGARIPLTRTSSLVLDGTEAKRGISIEYVSKKDFEAWEDKSSGSSVTHYDLVGTARVLREGLETADTPGLYGVFYDPLVPYPGKPLPASGTFDKSTRMPARALQSLGVKVTTPTPDTVELVKDDITLVFTADKESARVNDKDVKIATPLLLRKGTAYIPADFAVKTLGGTITREANGQVTLSFGKYLKTPKASTVTEMEFENRKISVVFSSEDVTANEERTREASREELRAQVKDFLAWLKEQGVI